jgi:hypothetical protein
MIWLLRQPAIVNDELGAQRPQPRERAVLIRTRQPTEADDVRSKDCNNFASLGHAHPHPFK